MPSNIILKFLNAMEKILKVFRTKTKTKTQKLKTPREVKIIRVATESSVAILEFRRPQTIPAEF